MGNIPPLTSRAINLLSYGGGNDIGRWTLPRLQAIYTTANRNFLASNGYDGVVFDVEEGDAIAISEWNTAFDTLRQNGFIVVVTISHFAPYQMANANELVQDWMKNSRIDYLSPQLYTSGNEASNDWINLASEWLNVTPNLAPSIVKESYYDQVPVTVQTDLPNNGGYFVWSNDESPGPGPTPDCASGYFPGSGCDYMCQWCQEQLGTDQYYWTTNVCTYDATTGGCQGSPQRDVEYTCCKVQ